MTGFLDLPPEVRLMIYRMVIPRHTIWLEDGLALRAEISSNICRVNRLLFSETNPLLYSLLEITVCPSRLALRFFRAVGQLNRDALHGIVLFCKVPDLRRYKCLKPFRGRRNPYLNRAVRLFNILTKCPKANLDIRTEPEALAYMDGSEMYPAFANMHGYARATVSIDDFQSIAHRNCNHGQHHVSLAVASMQERFDEGIKGMMAPCSSKCRIHEGRNVTKASGMVHFYVECEKCPSCSYEKFLAIYKESARSIFKALKN